MTSSAEAPLAVTLCGVALKTPVLAASGTFGYGVEFEKLVDLNALGGIVVKGLSREPIEGNPPPRIYETDGRHDQLHRAAEHRRARVRGGETAAAGALEHRGLRQRLRLPHAKITRRWCACWRTTRASRATS